MRILHIEDNRQDAELVREVITSEWPDCGITVTSQRPEYVAELRNGGYQLILSDFSLGGFDGLEALALAREITPQTPFIFLSGTIGEDRAIEAVRAGASDYVLKDRMKRLVSAIQRALREDEERKRRHEAERRIREQADVLNQAHDAIIITDMENRFTYWNSSAERLYGWKSEEVLGKAAEDIFNAEEAAAVRAACNQTEEKGEWRGELRHHNRAGHALIIDARLTLIRDESGAPKGRLGIISDVTQKKQLEEQLLRVQRTENIGLLAAGIAHDLNNVLAPILMAAPMLRERAKDPADVKMLTMLEKSAERGAGLVRQILAFAHGVSGEKRLMQVKHVLNEIIPVVIGTFPKTIRFEHSVPGALWPVQANATQIHQVLLNLCINARDAMPPQGGEISMKASNVMLDEAAIEKIQDGRTGPHLLLEVKDTGTGIPPEVLERMWEPFFTTKETGRGTGLGLSTVRSIVENHGGFMDVTTAAGKGSTFRVYIPAAEGATGAGAPAAPARPVRHGNGELILVVDDEKSVRDVATAILSSSGYRVLTAADGAEAMAIFSQRMNRIELVISDMQMPNFSGAVLARVLQRIDPDVRILAMSGMSQGQAPNAPKDANEIPNFGLAFLRKPFTVDDMLGKVDEVISKKT